ncbi:FtsL-like putative cell division protein [Polluticoccus soli]|uniref:FtsL-like putative cell division protein n=1 Tax=Polluticoccus soli TaxID=3034150 RepID=UPI0023E26ADA|nr:FtsL-like putative cell division protein [Flavipsychrobacter sp. JY13-12]
MSEQVNVQEQGQTPVQRVRNDWKTLVEKISYNAIVSNVPYLAFVAVLCVLYINNTQRAVEMQRELNKQNKILKELRWKYMDIKTQLMYTRMETQVIRNASAIGLKPLILPAYTIEKDSAATKPVD